MTEQWYYTPDGKTKRGPFSLAEMQKLAASGQVSRTWMARREDMTKWVPAGKVPEIFPAPSAEQGSAPAARPTSLPARGAGWVGAAWRAIRFVPIVVWQEIADLRLRRRLRRLQSRRSNLFQGTGVRLLAANISVPGCSAVEEQCRRLGQSHQLAFDAGNAGDRAKRVEARALASQLNTAYAQLGRQALESAVPFEGATESRALWRESEAAIALGQEQSAKARPLWRESSPRSKHLALCGFVATLGLLLVGVAFGLRGALASPQEAIGPPAGPAAPPPKADVAKAPEAPKPPAPPPRRTLKELFATLAPSVPIVEAVDSATGSGFLLEDKGKYLVVTNRHVIANARRGVVIHFLLGRSGSNEHRFTIPKEKARVVGIHRSADLAVVDVSAAAAEIRNLKIHAVPLAPRGHRPEVGEHVFAIGHPAGERLGLLTRTLSDGIISAVGRRAEEARFHQMTVPVNPGNSGGPLFDDDGRVVGVNTFIIRKSSGRDFALEALNFALESDFVHEIISDPLGKSLDAKAIAAVLEPPAPKRPPTLTEAMTAKVERFERAGYRRVKSLTKIFRLPAKQQRVIPMSFTMAGEAAVTVVSQGADDIDLAVLNDAGRMIASDVRINTDPEVTFRADGPGAFSLVVINPSDTEAIVFLVVLEK